MLREIFSPKIYRGNNSLQAEILDGGSYYVLVNNSFDLSDYSFLFLNQTTSLRETEPNSSILTADEYSFGTTTTGQTYSVMT